MSLDSLFPTTELTKEEIIEVKKHLSNPVVTKYLKSLAVEDSKELLTMSTLDMSDKEIANRHIFVSGKLAVTTTLLSIQE